MNKLSVFFRESSTARFLIPFGIILTIFGVFMFIINVNNKDYIKTEATVSRIELVEEAHTDDEGNSVSATYKVYVEYFAYDKLYSNELGELSGFKKGQKLTIYFNPQDPNKITQTKSLLFPIILVLSGILTFSIGIIDGLTVIKKYRKMKEQERGWSNE